MEERRSGERALGGESGHHLLALDFSRAQSHSPTREPTLLYKKKYKKQWFSGKIGHCHLMTSCLAPGSIPGCVTRTRSERLTFWLSASPSPQLGSCTSLRGMHLLFLSLCRTLSCRPSRCEAKQLGAEQLGSLDEWPDHPLGQEISRTSSLGLENGR